MVWLGCGGGQPAAAVAGVCRFSRSVHPPWWRHQAQLTACACCPPPPSPACSSSTTCSCRSRVPRTFQFKPFLVLDLSRDVPAFASCLTLRPPAATSWAGARLWLGLHRRRRHRHQQRLQKPAAPLPPSNPPSLPATRPPPSPSCSKANPSPPYNEVMSTESCAKSICE